MFNQAQDGLYGSGSKDRTASDLFHAIPGVKEPFIKFCRAHEKRLRLCVPFHCVGLAHPHEEDPTVVSIPGFVTECKGRGGVKSQPKSSVKVEMQSPLPPRQRRRKSATPPAPPTTTTMIAHWHLCRRLMSIHSQPGRLTHGAA